MVVMCVGLRAYVISLLYSSFIHQKLTDTMVITIAYLRTQNTNIIKRKQKKTRNNTQIPVKCLNIASLKELMLSTVTATSICIC